MRNRTWFRLTLTVLSVFSAGPLSAQNGEDARPNLVRPEAKSPSISVNARLVNVPVAVRDKKGVIVTNLTKDDFVLQVDGKSQTVRYFDLDTNLPLTLGLLVDTSRSQAKVLDQERTASGSFLETMLTPQRDKAFVIQFAHQVELLQDLTDSRPKLQSALKQVDVDTTTTQPDDNGGNNGGTTNTGSNNGGGRSGRGYPGGSGRGGGHASGGAGTALYDGVFLASDELMSKQTGRKAIVVLSDGEDRGSKENLTKSIEAAQRADVIVYAIYFKGESGGGSGGGPFGGGGHHGGGFPGGGRGGGYPGGGRGGQEDRVDGKKVLQRMADETGGRFFEITKKQTADEIYKQIAEELRSQYRLGFTPDAETASDGYHQIDLSLKRADGKTMSLQRRDGYYTGKP